MSHCLRFPRLRLGLSCVALLLATFSASAQSPWRSTLYPTNWTPPTTLSFESDKLIQDFSFAGYRRGDVAIPAVSGPVFNVTTYGADATGAADSTVAIQSAINAAAAAGGGVVYLPAGTFKVSPQGTNSYALRISTSNIVLRGAGRGVTFVFNDSYTMQNKHIIRVEGSSSSWSTVPSGSPVPTITSDLLAPSTSIPVSSVTGFVVGDWIILRADATDAFIAEHNMSDLWAGQGSALGGVMCQRQITAIDTVNNRLTIDVPTRYYLKTRDNARVHKVVPHVEEVGVEDFSIGNREHANANLTTGWGEEDYTTAGNGAYDCHASFAVAFRRVRNGWISNVATYRPAVNTKDTHILSNGILLDSCRGVTVRGCDIQRGLYGGGGGNGYMYRLQRANECLVRDSAARYSRHGFVYSHMGTSGNVIHGGIAQATRFQAAHPGTAGSEGCDHHMHLSHSNLMDGVQLDRDYFTAHYRGTSGGTTPHGQTSAHSVFWNLVGLAYYSTKTYIVRSEQARYGYMVGTRGAVTGMSTTASGGTRTLPTDHAEGAGSGSTLEPLSLYHDQLTRRLGAAPIPPVPTALTARGGDSLAVLSWNSASSAMFYTVRRATAVGGPYTTIATVDSTTFTDTNLADGTTYYYVVSALNAAGESADSYPASATPDGAFLQDSGTDGLAVAEIEHFDAVAPQGGHDWSANATAGSSGAAALQALPNSGTTRDTGYTTTSPRLDYRVKFVRTGTHYVWLRGLAASGGDDSVHVGLDGAATTTADRLTGFPTTWTWTRATMDGPVATLDITTTGIHRINVWMREDGAVLDKLLLTSNTAYTPSGTGAAESVRSASIAPPATPGGVDATAVSASRIDVAWSASTGATSYTVKRSLVSGGPYTTIASGLTGTSYSSTGLTANTPYYFVVTAVNADGPSGFSTEVSATTSLLGPLAFEAESLARTPVGAGASVGADTGASGGNLVYFSADAAGDYIDYVVPGIPAGTYQIKLRYKAHPNRGQHTLRANGTLIGGTLEQYSATAGFFEHTFGNATFTTAGNQTLRLTVTGKNAAAGAFTVTADSFTLVPQAAKLTVPGGNVTASADDGNVPANTVDGSLATRWSALGDGQWIRFDLGAVKSVGHVRAAFYLGDSRTSSFEVQTSTDGATWTTRLNATSSGTTTALETFDFTDVSARYVRLLGHGNSSNLWNSYTEVEVWGY